MRSGGLFAVLSAAFHVSGRFGALNLALSPDRQRRVMRLRSNHHRPLSVELAPTTDNTGGVSYLNLFPVEDLHLSGSHRPYRDRSRATPPAQWLSYDLLAARCRGHGSQRDRAKLGCTIGNSKSQLHQARLRLRRFLRRPALAPASSQAKATAALRRQRPGSFARTEIPPVHRQRNPVDTSP